MNKPKDRIYIKDWLLLKPYEKQTSTDTYYLKLSNKVKQAIITTKESFILNRYLDGDDVAMMSCLLTSYFEDLVSRTNVWNSYIRVHKKLYGKQLPFYDLAEYYEEEINLSDVCFLIWYVSNTLQQDKFIAPFNDFIVKIAEKVMAVFEEAWDYAPENEHLKKYYTIDKKETDYYTTRRFLDVILFGTYLFWPDTSLDLLETEHNIIEGKKDDGNLISLLNENRDFRTLNVRTRLLGLAGKEWAAEILGEGHPLSKDYREMSPKIRGYFLYKGQDEKSILLEHIASGKKFNIVKKSFDNYRTLKEVDTILYIGIVNWKSEWWFSGVYTSMDFDADLILDEKNSQESRKAVDFLDHQENDVEEILEDQNKAFLEFNNGSPLAFMESTQVEPFVDRYIKHFNASLKVSEQEHIQAYKREQEEGFLETEEESVDFSEVAESALVYFNPKSGVEIALGVNSAFPLPNNPFFDEAQSGDDILGLFTEEDISSELAMHCVNNYGAQLPFFKTDEGKMYLDYADFLLRFWKRNSYHTQPAITLTGVNNG